MKQLFRKGFSIFVAFVLLVASLISPIQAAASEFSYPAGVSATKAEEIVSSTDTLLTKAVQTASGKTLAQQIMPAIYESNLLGTLTVGIYSALSDEQMAEMLSMLSVSVSPADLAAVLYAYPEVSAALNNASSWNSADLSNASWNIKSKNEFASAVGTVLSPLYPLLQFLLCEGSFEIVGKLIKADGGNGYETAVIPLYKALGCNEYLSYSDYKKQADANVQAAGANLILPLLNYVEKMLAAPLAGLCDILPGLATFIINDGVENTINTLLVPVTQLMEKIEKIPLLNSAIAGSSLGNFSTDFTGTLIPDLNTMLQDSEMNITLPEINWEQLAACDSKGKTFVVVFRWLWEVLQNNADSLADMLNDGLTTQVEGMDAFDLTGIFDELLKDDADVVLRALAFMLNPDTKPEDAHWSFGTITTASFNFTEDMPRENYEKMIDGFDNLLGSLLAETMGAATLENAVQDKLYTSDNITALLKMIYSMLSDEEIAGIASVLGIDTSVSSVLNSLTDEKYKETVSFLKRFRSWDELPESGLSWGFADGDRAGFISACEAILHPFEDLLACLLAGQNYVLLDSITICGGNGYNNAMIPLFEALGVDASTYVSFEEYKNAVSSGNVLTEILSPLFLHLEKVSEAPVTYLTEQLPTICFFISDGGLLKMLYGLAIPVLTFIAGSGLSVDVTSLIEQILQFDLTFGEEQVNKLVSQLQNSENGQSMALPAIPALTQLASLGTAKEIDSKRTFNGKATTFTMIEADQASVLAYIVDFMVNLMQMPENSNLLMGTFMGDTDGADNPFAAYTDSFAAEMDGMSHDEMVKWFYDMLVFESDGETEDSAVSAEVPHIIYQPEGEKSNTDTTVIVAVAAIGIAIIAVLLVKKKKSAKTKTKKEETEE